ncbi:MAG: S8 family serine peptidase [Lachnospiraceae bacterium]|nr:S8 family serine peptidase [Lachnospiraceae bacterium]
MKKLLSMLLCATFTTNMFVPSSMQLMKNNGVNTDDEVVMSLREEHEENLYFDKNDLINDAINQEKGSDAARLINKIEDKEKFIDAVCNVLDTYYDDDGCVSEKIEEFTGEIDDAADDILKDYEEAAYERRNAEKLGYSSDSILVEFDSTLSDTDITNIMDDMSDGGEVITGKYEIDEELPKEKQDRIRKFFDERKTKIAIVNLGKDETTEKAIEEYLALDCVDVASRNYIETMCGTGDISDDLYSSQQWYLDSVNAKTAWETLENANECSKVRVAVIDSGIDMKHEDLEGKISKRLSVDITGTEPVLLADKEQTYVAWHGTMVSGIISAKTNNGKGIAGAVGNAYSENGYGVNIIAIQAGFTYGPTETMDAYFYIPDEIKALEYAVAKGADVINMSLSGTTYDETLERLLRDIKKTGIVVVAAAGNGYVSDEESPSYPSDYYGVVSVIGLDENDKKTESSNYGEKKFLSAPGSNILTCAPNNQYVIDERGGTSYAAPLVSSAVAIIKGIVPDLSPNDIRRVLKDTATDLETKGKDTLTGWGKVNLGLAAQMAVYESYKGVIPQISAIKSDVEGVVSMKYSRIANEEYISLYRSTSEDGTYEKIKNVQITSSDTISFNDKNLVSGTRYYYKIRCWNKYGESRKYGEYSDVISCIAR